MPRNRDDDGKPIRGTRGRENKTYIRRTRGVPLPYLRDYRFARLLSQGELGKAALVSIGAISLIESGENASFPTIRRLAKALGVTPDDLQFNPPAHPAPPKPENVHENQEENTHE